MKKSKISIGVVAPGCTLTPIMAEKTKSLASSLYAADSLELRFHPQCFQSHGHFAGPDQMRADALVEMANDPSLDAIWFARGGYGACRIVEQLMPRLAAPAYDKTYMGYSDAGTLLGALYRHGIGRVAHGPMPADISRDGGDEAVRRALAWFMTQSSQALEGSLVLPANGSAKDVPVAAFNITILSQMLGTGWQPDLSGHILMLEEVSEYMYRIDRSLCHIFGHAMIRELAGVRLGRCSLIPPNDPDFGMDEEAITREWCDRSGVRYLGRADIGHDVANKIVPFGVGPYSA